MVTMGVPIRSFCEGFNFETFTLNSRCGWVGGCAYAAGIFFWEHLELSNLEHITLGTLPRGPFFRFSKISNLTPPGQFLTFFWPTFLKAVAFFFGWSKSLALLDSEPHGGSLEPPFWIFQKYAFLHPWRTPDGFRFFKNRRKLTFLPTFLKTVPFIFGWSKSLTFLDLEAHGVPLGTPFWIFQKYAFLRPWRTSDGFRFFEIAGIWPFFSKICTKCCAVFFWLVLGLRYGRGACPKVS